MFHWDKLSRLAGHPKLMTTEVQNLRRYELMVIFSGDLTEKDFEIELGKMKQMLNESTKGITYEDNWGKKEFMYRIKKQKRGYYVVFNFNAEPTVVSELKAGLKINQYVLRYLIIILPENYEAGKYKEQLFLERKPREEKEKASAAEPVVLKEETKTDSSKPVFAGKKEEEQLANVEKKLEKILENPDIEIK